MVNTVSLTGAYSETAITSPRHPDEYSALDIVTGLSATRPSKVTVTTQLVDSAGNQVARVTTEAHLATGTTSITLPFSGADIAASGKNGSYRVTNLVVIDHTTGVQPIATQSTNVRTTASYAYTSFEAYVHENHSWPRLPQPNGDRMSPPLRSARLAGQEQPHDLQSHGGWQLHQCGSA
jgi:hypothetical protein